jgi:hypothetical protein
MQERNGAFVHLASLTHAQYNSRYAEQAEQVCLGMNRREISGDVSVGVACCQWWACCDQFVSHLSGSPAEPEQLRHCGPYSVSAAAVLERVRLHTAHLNFLPFAVRADHVGLRAVFDNGNALLDEPRRRDGEVWRHDQAVHLDQVDVYPCPSAPLTCPLGGELLVDGSHMPNQMSRKGGAVHAILQGACEDPVGLISLHHNRVVLLAGQVDGDLCLVHCLHMHLAPVSIWKH